MIAIILNPISRLIFVILCCTIFCLSAQGQASNKALTLGDMQRQLQRLEVNTQAKATQKLAIESLRKAIIDYCKAQKLSFEDCSSTQADNMNAWYRKRLQQMNGSRN